jgi:hypothetical protein
MAGGEYSLRQRRLPGWDVYRDAGARGEEAGGLLGAGGGTLYGLVHRNNQKYETLTGVVGILGATRDS